MVHVFIAGTFVINIHELLNFCPNVQFISSNKVLSTTILQSLSSLPPGTELSRLKAIPVVDYGVVYSLCVKKFSRTLMGIDLRSVMSDNKRAILDQEFPNLKKLALGSVDSPLDLINLVLTKSNHLEYLSFDLISPRLGTPLSATDKYPSLLELKIQFKIAHNVDYVGLNTLLFRFVNLEKLTVSIFDAISDNPPSDQLYAFRDFLAWANTVPNTKMCIKNFRHENLLTYLKYVCNTIPSDKEGWKTKVAFLRSSHYSGPIISYSTHTGYRERTLAITLDDYFARNLICNYLKKLQMPFTIWIQ
ncbi:hypothetical protein V8B55DRAFT_1562281 [Mucor lusitanicus]|uniref:F-box domain-containing protein n=2 Tax=Mucor circinelloides f. lusitanicus TaxID=29924 RepID=A0A168MBD3_MUCCL|nr:hypothetical protein FB192DRAFT_1444205 [Mucor lusitanicus]OAD04664.1 hypothetical protein MUCCIDRAFT_79766 [Mucor lusitanicus CBS 277.49]